MFKKETVRTSDAEARLLDEADSNEFALEMRAVRGLENGTCELKIDRRDRTITITDKVTGKPIFHTSIAEYDQLLEARNVFKKGRLYEMKEGLGGEH